MHHMQGNTQQDDMAGMDMGGAPEEHGGMQVSSLAELLTHHATAGTDAEPNSTPFPMLMKKKFNWLLMLHGIAFVGEIQQSGPRGGGKLFSTNWFMPMAQRKLGNGTLTLRTMFSLEPATVTQRRYPELFQQGETAFGRPIVDGQHPHDFFMEVAAMYDYRVGERTLLSLYAAPMGNPAMGPIAFPHRESASENPLAPLGHHLEDSTHIASDVLTGGVTYRFMRLEASGFHGREPDEYRWNIDSGKLDSWSVRASANPARNWSAQVSLAHLTGPEALAPTEDVRRVTASVIYNRPLKDGNWASLLLWGRNASLSHKSVGNGYLLESTLRLRRNAFWSRIENVDRTNELLLGSGPVPANFEEHYLARVQSYTAGYGREVGNLPHLSTRLSAQLTWYGVPVSLKGLYGSNPVGAMVFLRIRPY
jgi:hypothetical protein